MLEFYLKNSAFAYFATSLEEVKKIARRNHTIALLVKYTNKGVILLPIK
jgi:hypothetical protein